jgi:hypothetical protein
MVDQLNHWILGIVVVLLEFSHEAKDFPSSLGPGLTPPLKHLFLYINLLLMNFPTPPCTVFKGSEHGEPYLK